MPDPLFAELYGDTERLTWDPTDEVRERARRRTRRTRVAAGVACALAVATVATGAVAVAGGPDAAPPLPPATNAPAPSVSPDPTPSSASPTTTPSSPPPTTDAPSLAIPRAALLRVGDLPPGYRLAGDDLDGDWSLDAAASGRCTNDAPPVTAHDHLAERGVVFRADGDQVVIERVRRYSEADAKATVDRLIRLVADCRPEFALWETRVVGDQSLLAGLEYEGVWNTWVVARQDGVVAEIWLRGRNPDEARLVASRATEHLCAISPC